MKCSASHLRTSHRPMFKYSSLSCSVFTVRYGLWCFLALKNPEDPDQPPTVQRFIWKYRGRGYNFVDPGSQNPIILRLCLYRKQPTLYHCCAAIGQSNIYLNSIEDWDKIIAKDGFIPPIWEGSYHLLTFFNCASLE